MRTVIAAFHERGNAEHALAQLSAEGMNTSGARLVDQAARGAEMIDDLEARGVPDDIAECYGEALRRGAAIVVCETADDQAGQVADIFDRDNSIDLQAASARWRSEGWAGYRVEATELDEDARRREREAFAHESIPVIEEETRVGKREGPGERVRVRTFVTERPVRELVELREEHVGVTREAANEPVSPGAAEAAFQEKEYEVTARAEEPVVEKQARVVERVTVEKRPETRTETIEGTERRREVEVEETTPGSGEPSKRTEPPGH
jgi:hypothetical protein